MYQKFHTKQDIENFYLIDTIIGIGKKKSEFEDEQFGDIFQNTYSTEQINEREYTISKYSDKVWEKYPLCTLADILFSENDSQVEGCIKDVFKTKFFIAGF